MGGNWDRIYRISIIIIVLGTSYSDNSVRKEIRQWKLDELTSVGTLYEKGGCYSGCDEENKMPWKSDKEETKDGSYSNSVERCCNVIKYLQTFWKDK